MAFTLAPKICVFSKWMNQPLICGASYWFCEPTLSPQVLFMPGMHQRSSGIRLVLSCNSLWFPVLSCSLPTLPFAFPFLCQAPGVTWGQAPGGNKSLAWPLTTFPFTISSSSPLFFYLVFLRFQFCKQILPCMFSFLCLFSFPLSWYFSDIIHYSHVREICL